LKQNSYFLYYEGMENAADEDWQVLTSRFPRVGRESKGDGCDH